VNPKQVLVTGCDAGKRTALLNMLEEYVFGCPLRQLSQSSPLQAFT
jgi:hypothetical protein